MEVFCDGLAVVIPRGVAGVAESAQIDGENPMLLCQHGNDLMESPPGFREAVNQDDGRAAVPR